MEFDLKRVVVGLTTAQRLQGMISSLGVCESGRVVYRPTTRRGWMVWRVVRGMASSRWEGHESREFIALWTAYATLIA